MQQGPHRQGWKIPAPARPRTQTHAVTGGGVHVVYRDASGSQNVTYYGRSLDGGNSWGPDVSLGNYYWWPSLAASGFMVFVALNDNNPGNTEAYCRRSADFGSAWGEEKQLSPEGPNAVYPVVARDGSNVHVIWTDQRDDHPVIYYKRNPSGNSMVAGIVSGRTESTPLGFSLSVFPNPFNPAATVEFSLPVENRVILHVYDLLGREVARLLDGEQKRAGPSSVVFDGSGLSPDVYLCRLDAGRYTTTKKILLVK
jgi:hypothetical protein